MLLNLLSTKNSVIAKMQNSKYKLPNNENIFKDKNSSNFINKV